MINLLANFLGVQNSLPTKSDYWQLKKPHVICEVLASSQLKLLIAERKIYQSEIGSIDVSIKALNSAIALLQKCENKEKEINQLGKKK